MLSGNLGSLGSMEFAKMVAPLQLLALIGYFEKRISYSFTAMDDPAALGAVNDNSA